MLDTDRFEDELRAMGRGRPENEGFFGPESMLWKISRENVLYLAGPRALFLQIAHPKVARGVFEHSNYERDPFGRALRTFGVMYEVIFGTKETAIAAGIRVLERHAKVKGSMGHANERYSALDPKLLAWVQATLIEGSLFAYQTFFEPLTQEDCEAYYRDAHRLSRFFGVPDGTLPRTYSEFQQWFFDTIESDDIIVTDEARRIASALLNGPWWLRVARPFTLPLSAGTLPEKIRDGYGFSWGRLERMGYKVEHGLARFISSTAPRVLRFAPPASLAHVRLRTGLDLVRGLTIRDKSARIR